MLFRSKMEVSGTIKLIKEEQQFGDKGFRKRELIITTKDQYPQVIMIEFTQNNCDFLNNFNVGQDVNIKINIRGREWVNPEGEIKYFNSIQGWKIAISGNSELGNQTTKVEEDDLPF